MAKLEYRGKRAINLACGTTYLKSDLWLNVDWSSTEPEISKVNLLDKLPFADNSFELAYTSHFIEHLKPADFDSFITECFRILSPEGILRIVTPNWDEMLGEYINQIKNKNYKFADYVRLEIIDQCVRLHPGGRLREVYKEAVSDPELVSYIEMRSGRLKSTKTLREINKDRPFVRLINFCHKIRRLKLYKVVKRAQKIYILFIVRLLPEWFRRYNVALTDPGEKHMWLFTQRELIERLSSIGFKNVITLDHQSTGSRIQDCLKLDSTAEGAPRKGKLSMFIEATKA
jgi:predicted SAM-dependent methyltransferase